MTSAVFQTQFHTVVAERGAPYIAAREKILAGGPSARAEASTVLRQTSISPADWRTNLAAEILLGWFDQKELFLKSDRYARGALPPPAPLPGFTARHRAGAIAELGPGVVPRVLERLWKTGEYGDETECEALFGALREIADRRAVPPMIALVDDPSTSAQVRGSAASLLSSLGDPHGLEPVLRLARDPKADPAARGVAIRSLGRFDDAKATQALVDLLNRRDLPLDERRAAADGLLKRADPATRSSVLLAAEREHDPLIQVALIQTMGRIGTMADIPGLKNLGAKDRAIAKRVNSAVEDIQARAGSTPAKP